MSGNWNTLLVMKVELHNWNAHEWCGDRALCSVFSFTQPLTSQLIGWSTLDILLGCSVPPFLRTQKHPLWLTDSSHCMLKGIELNIFEIFFEQYYLNSNHRRSDVVQATEHQPNISHILKSISNLKWRIKAKSLKLFRCASISGRALLNWHTEKFILLSMSLIICTKSYRYKSHWPSTSSTFTKFWRQNAEVV